MKAWILSPTVTKCANDFPSAAESFLIQKQNYHYMVKHMHHLAWFLYKIKLIGHLDPIPEIFALGTLISLIGYPMILILYQIYLL